MLGRLVATIHILAAKQKVNVINNAAVGNTSLTKNKTKTKNKSKEMKKTHAKNNNSLKFRVTDLE